MHTQHHLTWMKSKAIMVFLWSTAVMLLLLACASGHTGQADGKMTMPSPTSMAPSEADLGKAPSPDFQLRDQRGQAITLSQLQGKVIVLSFPRHAQ